ncbi:zinc finger protein 836 [Agrilus planipennis]|uniref:Zinc finger protein 836 n=1 Tax=Agrilus planipennis TaxID=224129 RepID=A0A1W4XU66_AGRPL|nr:zinc finger protein 836 [Agrilus planipennis]
MEEQVVTIDVVPQTVTEVIYLSPQGLNFDKTVEVESYYSSSGEEHENEIYEIGCVDATQVEDMPLVYDQSESFVMLSDEYQIDHDNNEQGEVDNISECNDTLVQSRPPVKRKKFSCHVCKSKFSSRKKLFHHRVLHKSSMEKGTKQTGNILNNTPVINSCKVCGKKFERTQALSIHFRKCHQAVPVVNSSQPECSINEDIKECENRCREIPKFYCNICGCPCVNDIALLFHYRKHEPKTYSCDICEAGYNDENDFINHKKTHHIQFLYACNKCDESFPTTALVSYHIRQVHAQSKTVKMEQTTNRNLSECPYSTNNTALDSNSKQLSMEKASQFPRRKHTCNICNLQFRFQAALTRHLNEHMKQETPDFNESNVN